jgi:O-antigen/teichoic acid export membrane protein
MQLGRGSGEPGLGPLRLEKFVRGLLIAWIVLLGLFLVLMILASPMACDGQAPGCEHDMNAVALTGVLSLSFEVFLVHRMDRVLRRSWSSGRRWAILGVSFLLSLVVPLVILLILDALPIVPSLVVFGVIVVLGLTVARWRRRRKVPPRPDVASP